MNAISLISQPLPPLKPRIHNVAAMVVKSLFHAVRSLKYQDKEQQQITVKRLVQQLDDLSEWCGTVPVSERIRELLKKLGVPIPTFLIQNLIWTGLQSLR